MAKIFVAGALEFARHDEDQFVAALGAEVIGQGHTLLDGCRNELDRRIAKSAVAAASVHDIPVILWSNQKSLKDQLRERIRAIASEHGR